MYMPGVRRIKRPTQQADAATGIRNGPALSHAAPDQP
jgi:hypothetical protein